MSISTLRPPAVPQLRFGKIGAIDLLALVLLSLLLPGSIASADSPGETCSLGSREESKPDGQPADEQFIIRFNNYEVQESHQHQLEASLPGLGSRWRWVPRHNRAAPYPTDFGLVSSSWELPELQQRLGSLKFVKDVHHDKRIQGALKWKPEGPLKDVFMDEGLHEGQQKTLAPASEIDQQQQQNQGVSESTHHVDETLEDGFFSESADSNTILKRAGRMTTRFMMEGEEYPAEEEYGEKEEGEYLRKLLVEDWVTPEALAKASARRSLTSRGGGHDSMSIEGSPEKQQQRQRSLLSKPLVADMMNAGALWRAGFSGKGVKVGVFDTGINDKHPHIRNIKERTNWTHQASLGDGLGHGSFVAGVIGGQSPQCPGFAPDVDLYTFKVFTDDQVSYTSWFLDAFNYAITVGVNIINLSIGGPDFMDSPFVDKVLEITSNKIMMVSAIGNDGPHYGTLNNPADMPDVIGVGGIDSSSNLAGFSSRGMTTWELPVGSGRVKPDVVAFGKDVMGSSMHNGCRSLSGTSVASPVVAGAVCLLASTVPIEKRWSILNPASMKQALVEGADKLGNMNIYEQGNGRVNLENSMAILKDYSPRASIIPASLDLTNCPYMWPYCKQPLYAGALPIVFNATILNGMGLTGKLEGPPTFKATDTAGSHLKLNFEYSPLLWPWTGYLALFIRVRSSGASYHGFASATVSFTIISPPAVGETAPRRSVVTMPITVAIIPTPERKRRVLWDQFHSIKYPPAYIPRDNLEIRQDVLDWHGDHLFTNFHGVYNYLREKGFFLEVLSSPLTCFNADLYGAVLIVDAEEEYYPEEIAKIRMDVEEHGLNLIVFAEWYNLASMLHMKFFDDNTRSWWSPATGGSNVPALNDLLSPYGMALGDSIISGHAMLSGNKVEIHSGADIAKMPAGSFLHRADLSSGGPGKAITKGSFGVLGVNPVGKNGGHVAVFSDSNCLDFSHQRGNCYEFLQKLLDRLLQGAKNGIADDAVKLAAPLERSPFVAPIRRRDMNFSVVSFVKQHALRCYSNGACEFQDPPGCDDQGARSVQASMGSGGVPSIVKGTMGSIASGHSTSASLPAPKGIPSVGMLVALSICFAGLILVVAIWAYRGRVKKSRVAT